MMIKKCSITGNQTILLQAFAVGSLLAELQNSEFINSYYYNNIWHKEIVKLSGIKNTATIHFMPYVYLVMQMEMLLHDKYSKLVEEYDELNRCIAMAAEKETFSTYSGKKS